MENNIKEEKGVFLKGSVDKFAVLVLKHIAKQQEPKLNTFAFKSIQPGFCRLGDAEGSRGEEDVAPSPKRLTAWHGDTRAAGT